MAIPVENDDYKQKENAKMKIRNKKMASFKQVSRPEFFN